MTLSPVSSGDPHVSAHNEERAAINDLLGEMPGKMPLPTLPTTGSVLIYDGTNWVPGSVNTSIQDTGWRDITALVQKRNTAVVVDALLRRVGSVVDLYLNLQTPTNTASPWVVLTLPAGFRPAFDRAGILQDNKETAAQTNMIGSNGEVNLYNISAGKTDRFNATYTTTNAWPSSLPGTAA